MKQKIIEHYEDEIKFYEDEIEKQLREIIELNAKICDKMIEKQLSVNQYLIRLRNEKREQVSKQTAELLELKSELDYIKENLK